ncbi:MAG: DUF4857 domain-containing protein [Opitutales bacterium]|nr:DUF4857 domain-containing protein [Opitutales bacterium]
MIHFVRILLFLLATGVLSHYLPLTYWIAFSEKVEAPYTIYSSVLEDFAFYRFEESGIRYMDRSGVAYSEEAFQKITPLHNYLQLYHDGKLPDEIRGVPISTKIIREQRTSLRLKAPELDFPGVALYPLMDSATGKVELETTGEFMRPGHRIELLDSKTNRLLSDKGRRFTEALADAGFVFPATAAYGNSTTRKPYDEGYFLVDQAGTLFQLQMKRGEPFVTKPAEVSADPLWQEIHPRHILVSEQANKELRCLIIGQDDSVWMVVGEGYRPVRVPFQHYLPAESSLRLSGNVLYVMLTVQNDDWQESIVFNRSYDLLDTYSEALPSLERMPQGRIASVLFPWTLQFRSEGSGYIGFYAESGSPWSMLLSLALALLSILFSVRRGSWSTSQKIMSLLMLPTGIFGFVAYWCIPPAAPRQNRRIS